MKKKKKNKSLFTVKLDLYLRKKPVQCYIGVQLVKVLKLGHFRYTGRSEVTGKF